MQVICPALEKGDEIVIRTYTFANAEEYTKDIKDTEKGILEKDGKTLQFCDLVDGGVYTLGGGFRNAILNDTRRRQADDRVLQVECGQAVKLACGAEAHIHYEAVFQSAGDLPAMELDNVVVHSHKEDTPDATAYIVETSFSPQPKEVDILLKKVENFKLRAPTHPHFKNCSAFVPVLGGRKWSQATLDRCKKDNIAKVVPSGMGYKCSGLQRAVRGLCTMMRWVPM